MRLSHTVEVRTGSIEHEIHDALLERFASTLIADKSLAAPAVSFDPTMKAIEVRASVDTTRTVEAIKTVVDAIDRALRAAHIIATQNRIEAWPDIIGVDWPDELVNGGEVARRLQISRERVRQLLADKPPRFPRPVAETERDKIWRWGDVAEWAALTERKAKAPRRRPLKTEAQMLDIIFKAGRTRERFERRAAAKTLARK
jgi:predicted DNA-binding transcriptional regulator AlpA